MMNDTPLCFDVLAQPPVGGVACGPSSQSDSCLWQLQEHAGVFSWWAEWQSQQLFGSPRLVAGLKPESSCLKVSDLWNAVRPADRASCEQAWGRSREIGTAEIKHGLELNDGKLRIVQHVIRFCPGVGEQPDYAMGLIVDVTEREKLHARLCKAHSEVVSILEAVGEGVYAIDSRGCITQVNSAGLEALGYQNAIELIGQNAHQRLHHSRADGTPMQLSECELHGRGFPGIRQEELFYRCDGSSFWASCFSTPIKDTLGNVRGAVITFRDLTEERRRQAQLTQAQKLESIGQLAAGVAHEINTPMQYIGDNVRYVSKTFEKMEGLLGLLPAFVDPEVSDEALLELRRALDSPMKPRKVKSSLRQIPEALMDSSDGVKSVSKIVAAMKEFSHPGGDDMRRVTLGKVLESTITVAKNEWKYVADVVTNFAEGLPEIPAYPSELNQAFLNVIVNAAHAIGDRVKEGRFDKGEICVSTRQDDDFLVVTISDNGGGIPKGIRQRVMEPFFTTKEVGKGTGQGLAIAHSVITKKHQGEFSFDVTEGVGTSFEFRLPIQSEQEHEAAAESHFGDRTS